LIPLTLTLSPFARGERETRVPPSHAFSHTTSKLASNNGLRQATLSNRTRAIGWVGIVILYLMGGGVRARSLDIPQDVL
jgi:hypothetical protein